MNPLTNMKNVTKLSEQELYTNNRTSWHDQYRDSAWVFIGGLPFDLSEGDIICIFSQYGEVVNINLIRDKDNGKSKGFCFLCYEDQRSTILAVDNFNGIRVLNRILRVDHVSNYKIPKQGEKTDAVTKELYSEGCAPKAVVHTINKPIVKLESQCLRETLSDQIQSEIKLPERLPIYPIKKEPEEDIQEAALEKTVDKKTEKSFQKNPKNESDTGSENDRRSKKKYSQNSTYSKSNADPEYGSKSKEAFSKPNNDSSGSSRETKHKLSKKYRKEETTYRSRSDHDLKKASSSRRPDSPYSQKRDRSEKKNTYLREVQRHRHRSRSRSREYKR